jgi:tetratricopeptide (TPR) repeat protein
MPDRKKEHEMRKLSRLLLCVLPLLLAVGCLTSKSKEEVVRRCLFQATQREKVGDFQGALTALDEAIEADPNNGSVLARRGMVKTQLNDTDEALKDFNLAIRLDPDNVSAYLGLGLLHRQLKETDASLADLNRAIALAPYVPELYVARGRTYAGAGMTKKAIQDFSQAIELNPTEYAAYMERAYASMTLRQNDRAMSDLQYVMDHAKDRVFVQRARELLDELSEKPGNPR